MDAKRRKPRWLGWYVEQSDIHTPALTVVESLSFSAHLRLARNVNKRSENIFVDNVSPLLLYCTL